MPDVSLITSITAYYPLTSNNTESLPVGVLSSSSSASTSGTFNDSGSLISFNVVGPLDGLQNSTTFLSDNASFSAPIASGFRTVSFWFNAGNYTTPSCFLEVKLLFPQITCNMFPAQGLARQNLPQLSLKILLNFASLFDLSCMGQYITFLSVLLSQRQCACLETGCQLHISRLPTYISFVPFTLYL